MDEKGEIPRECRLLDDPVEGVLLCPINRLFFDQRLELAQRIVTVAGHGGCHFFLRTIPLDDGSELAQWYIPVKEASKVNQDLLGVLQPQSSERQPRIELSKDLLKS